MTNPRRLGKLPPKYIFVLNPYDDVRFSRCPNCDGPTKVRKLPFFIHIDPKIPLVLNKTHRYCPACDLIILHRDELEAILLRMFPDRDPEALREQYLVMGTVERKVLRAGLKGAMSVPEMLAGLHDFKEVRTVKVRPAGWYRDDPEP